MKWCIAYELFCDCHDEDNSISLGCRISTNQGFSRKEVLEDAKEC